MDSLIWRKPISMRRNRFLRSLPGGQPFDRAAGSDAKDENLSAAKKWISDGHTKWTTSMLNRLSVSRKTYIPLSPMKKVRLQMASASPSRGATAKLHYM